MFKFPKNYTIELYIEMPLSLEIIPLIQRK